MIGRVVDVSDTAFFLAAKLAGLLIRPDVWLATLVTLTCVAVWAGRGRWLALITVALLSSSPASTSGRAARSTEVG